MQLPHFFILAAQLSAVLALPASSGPDRRAALLAAPAKRVPHRRHKRAEENNGNEIEQEGQFGTAIVLGGNNVKTDTLFPPGKVGRLEVEFQNNLGRTLTVTENKSPAPPPAGFTALEPSSYRITLAEGPNGISLTKVDFIRNANSTVDISKGQIGRLCTEAGAFVIDPAVGELEFEAEENELAMKVKNINAEWGIFLPQAASAGAGGARAGAGNGAAKKAGAGAGKKAAANKEAGDDDDDDDDDAKEAEDEDD